VPFHHRVFLFVLALIFIIACSSRTPGSDDESSEKDSEGVAGDDLLLDFPFSDAPDLSFEGTDADEPSVTDADDHEGNDGDNDVLVPDDDSSPCTATFSGIYEISGSDVFGTYTGTGEIREIGMGSASLVRAIRYDHYRWNGYRVAQVMSGIIGGDYRGLFVYFKLNTGGFVKTVNGVDRPFPEHPVIDLAGNLFKTATCGGYYISVQPVAPATEGAFSEEWIWREPAGNKPLWKNERMEIPANPEPTPAEKATINQTYKSFHDLPDVKPYTEREEFKKMVHYMVVDSTDRAFLRDNPDTVRIIQRPINDWTLAEAEMRRSAFVYTLAQKKDYFTDLVQQKMINELGMVSHWNDSLQRYDPDGDSLLWTGVYVATMAWQYLIEGGQEALDRMIKSLEGILMCVEIVPDTSTFARTVRLHVEDSDPEFHEGTGAFAGIDWKEGGNNDMYKGFIIGYYWAWLVLRESSDLRAAGLIGRMMNSLKRLHDNCDVARDLRMNQLAASLLLYAMSEGNPEWFIYRTAYKNEIETIWTYVSEYISHGGLPINEYGISDWSGNHLGVWEFFVLREAFETVGDGTRVAAMAAGLSEKGEAMRPARQGLFQLIVGSRGIPQSVEDIASGIERLHEIPLERGLYAVDRRWSPDFCMSPIPELFWKNDWTTNDRTQSLRAYPLYEMGTTSYYWKDNIYKGIRGGKGTGGDTGLDFLAAYWFARRYNLISGND